MADPSEDQKKPKWPKPKYGYSDCKRCRELDKLKFVPKPDDHDYIYEGDDFHGDEEFMLRVIHYRRTWEVTGGFNVDCPPSSSSFIGRICPREHYCTNGRDYFDKNLKLSLKFAVDTYNQQKGQNLVILGIQNVNVEQGGCWCIHYVTLEGFNDRDDEKRRKSYVQIYQTVVSYELWRWRSPIFKLHVFRRSNPTGKDEDLLPPDPSFEDKTTVRKELMWTLA